jgi:hypothetical protein
MTATETARQGTTVLFIPTAMPVMMLVPWPVVLACVWQERCVCTYVDTNE